MTIITTQDRITYAGDNVSTLFAIPFEFFLNSDITAIKTTVGGAQSTLTQGIDYSLAGAGVAGGGSATKTTALLTGETLAIFLNPPITQQSHYPSNSPFPASTLENDLDRQTQISQRLQDQISRSLRVPDGDAAPSMLLPPAALRALQFQAFDVNGNAIVVPQLPGSAITQASIGAVLWPKTPIEITAGTVIAASWYMPYDPRRYGADQTGVADSTAAFNASPNVSLVFPGTYLTNSQVTAGKPIVSFNASFTGANPVNSWMPNFGANDFTVMEFLGGNAIVGAVQNNLGAVALSGVAITGIAGQFSCTAGALAVGMFVFIQGTIGGTGSITGYSNPTQYKISATNGTTTFTLTTLAGGALVTTAGAPTGLTYNTSPAAGTTNFPTGTTGYARINTAGNSGFGLFGQADLWATGNAIGAEVDAFNYAAAPANSFPVNLAFGTPGFNAIPLLIAAYGNFTAPAALYIAIGAQQAIAGIYVHFQAASQYGMLIDSGSAQGPAQPLFVRGMSGVIPVTIQTIGTFAANNGVVAVIDGTTATRASWKQDGHFAWSATATSATAGANGAVPAQVAGYFVHEVIGGSLVKVPYFNT